MKYLMLILSSCFLFSCAVSDAESDLKDYKQRTLYQLNSIK